MRSHFPQGRNIFTGARRSSDVHQSMSCLALVRFEFVLFRDRIEIFDDATGRAQCPAAYQKGGD